MRKFVLHDYVFFIALSFVGASWSFPVSTRKQESLIHVDLRNSMNSSNALLRREVPQFLAVEEDARIEMQNLYSYVTQEIVRTSHTIEAAPGHSSTQSDIALCIAGESRTFSMPLVHVSMKRNLIDTLRPDVFGLLQKMETNIFRAVARGIQTCGFEEASLNKIMFDVLGAKKVTYSNADLELAPLRQCQAVGPATVMLAMHDVCFRMVRDYEIERGLNYSYWVNVRPDVLMLVPVHPGDFAQPQHTVPKGDFLHGGPREAVIQFLNRSRQQISLCDSSFEAFEQLVDRFLSKPGVESTLRGNQALVRGLQGDTLLIHTFDGQPTCLAEKKPKDAPLRRTYLFTHSIHRCTHTALHGISTGASALLIMLWLVPSLITATLQKGTGV